MPSFRQKISCEIYTVGLDMVGIGRYDLLESSRVEPSRVEPSRVESSRVESSRAEPSRAEPSRAEPSRAENPRIVKSSLRSFCKINYIITKSFYNCKRFMK